MSRKPVTINTESDHSAMDEWWLRFWSCPKCGSQVAYSMHFCYHCGVKINWEGE